MANLTLPAPRGAKALYDIPADDWAAMNGRATVVVNDEPIAKIISKEIPNYDELLVACESWKKSVFPQIIDQAGAVATMATTVSGHLKDLQSMVADLSPADPVPEKARFIISVNLKASADSASDQVATAASLQPLIAGYVKQNVAADKAITSALPKDWVTASETITALESSASTVQSDWGQVAGDLAVIVNKADSVTTADLKVADYTQAVAAWEALHTAAQTFLQHASGSTTKSGEQQ